MILEGECVNISKLKLFTILPTISGVWEGPKVAPSGVVGTTKKGLNSETMVSGVVIMPYLVNSG